jgi:beta-glucosidase
MSGSARGWLVWVGSLGIALSAGLMHAQAPVPPAGQGVGAPGGGGRGGRGQTPAVTGPWSDKTLSPDRRAELLVEQMTLDEKITMLHGGGFGFGGRGAQPAAPTTPPVTVSNGGAGFVSAVPRLGIPAIQMADAAYGVTRGSARGRYSTALPSDVMAASSWDVSLACEYGGIIGQELKDEGYGMSLAGGVNIARDPRNGRIFEYKGEDPILAGKLVGQEMKCLQSKGVLGDIKHYALNDQETGRNIGNVILDKRSMRETDLLAYEIGIKDGDIAGVMCSYNKVNGDWSCENSYLLTDVLKKAIGHKGFVVSDWGGTHSTAKAALAGLEIEEPGSTYFGEALKKAAEAGEVPMARIDDMVKRVLRSMFAVGLFDEPERTRVPDVFAGLEVAERVAERGMVLLKNDAAQLPLNRATVKSIAVIGSHADKGVLSGGGSAQVDSPGGNAAPPPPNPAGGGRGLFGGAPTWYPSAPLTAIRAKAPNAKVQFNDGTDPAAAAALAKTSEVAIVFVNQPASEGRDVSLTLPNDQDALVAAVAAANPHTIVVAETGGTILMPWAERVSAILEAWYPGIRGGQAIASVLFGDVNPSGKTTLTFARSEADLPHATVFGPPAATSPAPAGGTPAFGRGNMAPFDIPYTEGLLVGYKWFDAKGKAPLFPFGHGLSYTTFAYSGLTATAGREPGVRFTVRNTGRRAGIEIVQVYAGLPASTGEPPHRLVAWQPVELKAGESKTVTLPIDPLHLSIFDVDRNAWQLAPGEYTLLVGGSSRSLPLSTTIRLGS